MHHFPTTLDSLKYSRRRSRKWMISCEKDLFEAAGSYARAKKEVEELDLRIEELENCEED